MCQRSVAVVDAGSVQEAYDIAWDYLARTGAITAPEAAHVILLDDICRMFADGERNKIRMSNEAIKSFCR